MAEHYAALHARGMELGASLQAVRRLWRGEGQALGELALDPGQHAEATHTLLHPALLDACLQLLAAARAPAGADPGAGCDTYLPVAIDSLRTFGPVGTQAPPLTPQPTPSPSDCRAAPRRAPPRRVTAGDRLRAALMRGVHPTALSGQ